MVAYLEVVPCFEGSPCLVVVPCFVVVPYLVASGREEALVDTLEEGVSTVELACFHLVLHLVAFLEVAYFGYCCCLKVMDCKLVVTLLLSEHHFHPLGQLIL